MARDVFVSYAATDQAVADAVCTRLESRHHLRCWIAPRDVAPGASLAESSKEALDRSKVMVLIASGTENASAPTDGEVQRAIHRGINIVTLRIEPMAPTETLELRTDRLAESVKALLENRPGAVAKPGAAVLERGRPGAPASPNAARGKSTRLVAAAVGGVIVVAVLAVVASRLGNQATPPVRDTVSAKVDPNQTSASALPPSVPVAEPVPTAEPAPASPTSPETPDARSVAAGGTLATPQPDQTPASPAAPATNQPSAEPPVVSPTAAKAVTDKPAAKPAESVAASVSAASGTLFIDFINTFPDGSVEVEIDGRRRWSEQLRLGKTTGVLSAFRVQRASEQLGSELRVPAGDHKITVTVLNAEGEVRDFVTTAMRVDASSSATLKIRVSRFRNKLQVE